MGLRTRHAFKQTAGCVERTAFYRVRRLSNARATAARARTLAHISRTLRTAPAGHAVSCPPSALHLPTYGGYLRTCLRDTTPYYACRTCRTAYHHHYTPRTTALFYYLHLYRACRGTPTLTLTAFAP